ncbi:MAG: tetratricopeptide repeat-containing sulfotransferase family protein [Gammaproteobacteria bacterium]
MNPNKPEGSGATLADAMSRHQAGDLAAARQLYQKHLEKESGDANAWCLLAALEGQAGDHAGAGDAFRQASVADPGWAPAYAGLGTSLLLRGNPEASIPALQKALELKPANVDVRMQLALACRRTGRLDQTIVALEEVLRRNPDHPDARYLLAASYLESGQFVAAENCYRAVIKREPAKPRAYLGLGGTLLALHRAAEAEEVFLQAARVSPSDPEPLTGLGDSMRNQGRLADAEATFEKARVLAGQKGRDIAKATVGLAGLDRMQGRSEKALDRLQPLLDRPSPPTTVFVTAIRLMMDVGRLDEALAYLKTWLALPNLGPVTNLSLLSLQGQVLDRLERVDEAWQVWGEVNKSARGNFDATHYSGAIDAVCEAFSADVFARFSTGPEWQGARPVLLVGTPRSGKSILEQLLACHPSVHGAGELRLLGQMTEMAREKAGTSAIYPDCVAGLDPGDISALSDWYRDALAGIQPGVGLITDTQPTNFLHLGLAAIVCPGIKVIFCRRDPLDVAWACYGRAFNDPALAFVASPEGLGNYLAGMDRLARHWKTEAPADILEIDYEKLVADPESEIRRVVAFLGLPWSDLCLQYDQPGTASLSVPPTVSSGLVADEVGRGQRYRQYLSALEAGIGRGI